MWQVYVFGFLAGVFGVNGIPHFLNGLAGKKFKSPFGENSDYMVNIVWGWLNFIVAGIFLFYSHSHIHLLRTFASVMVGALVMALLLPMFLGLVDSKKK
jgi:hypothetical protein